MNVEILFQEFTNLSPQDQARFRSLVDATGDTPGWAERATEAITEEEWQAMEDELEGVRQGTVQTKSLSEVIAALT